MYNFLVGTGIFDESFTCLHTDEELLTYLGTSCRSTLTSHIHKSDVDIFLSRAREVLSGSASESRALIRFIISNGETRICRVRIFNSREKNTIFVEITDIENACDECNDFLDSRIRTEWFLAFEKETLINYNFQTGKLDIFKFTESGRMSLLNNTIYEKLADELRKNFESPDFEYSYRTEYETDGNIFLINGFSAYHNDERTVFYGIIRNKDEKGGIPDDWGNTHDPLTGLYNRPYALSESKHLVDEQGYVNLSFVMVNIDDFRTINETYGSAFGNKVLQKLSIILNRASHGRGFAAHFSSDSFFVVLIDINTEDELRAVLHGINFKFLQAFPDVDHQFTLSMGIAEYPRNSIDYDTLIKKAERALYIAKFKGKSRYVIYKETMHGELTEEFIREAPKASPHNREEQYNVIKDILTSVVIANNSAPGSLPEALDGALVTLMLKYRCDALTVYCGKTYLPVFKKGHYPGEPGNAIFLRNPKVRALFNNRGICYVNLDHIHGAEIDEYHHNMKKRGIKSSLQFIIGENNSPAALFAFDCFNDMGVYTAEETNDLLFFSHMIYAILVKFKIFC